LLVLAKGQVHTFYNHEGIPPEFYLLGLAHIINGNGSHPVRVEGRCLGKADPVWLL
jgi:hypothetical protein